MSTLSIFGGRGLLSGGMILIVLWMVALSGFAMGAHVGLTADSPAEADLVYNGTHFGPPGNMTDATVNWSEPQQYEPPQNKWLRQQAPQLADRIDREPAENRGVVAKQTRSFAEGMLDLSFSLAAAVGSFSAPLFYNHGSEELVTAVDYGIRVAGILPIAAYAYLIVGRVRRLA